MKVKATVFEMPTYKITAGNSRVKTGKQIHVVENQMFNQDFTISPFINGVFFHFTMNIEIYGLIR